MVRFLLCGFILCMFGIVRLFFELRLFRIGLVVLFYRMSSKSLFLGLVAVLLGIFLGWCFNTFCGVWGGGGHQMVKYL